LGEADDVAFSYADELAQIPDLIVQLERTERILNDSMGGYVAKQSVKKMIAQGKHIQDTRVLVMGATFKEDVSDIRNTKVIDVVKELQSYQVSVDLIDPHASSEEMIHEYGIGLHENPEGLYDAIIVAVNHKEYLTLNEDYFKSLLIGGVGTFVDIKGIYRGKIKTLDYWSL
jgi:UDP-N-acetyl-D-galactosamine dehydrogenase